MHKDRAMIFGKPLFARLAAKQECIVFAVARTGGNVAFTPDPIIRAFFVGAKMIGEICHPILLSCKGLPEVTLKGRLWQEKTNND